MRLRRHRREEPVDPELAELLELQAEEAERLAAEPPPAPLEPRQEPDRTPPSAEEVAAQPTFRYHPDPIGSGSIVRGDATCAVCGRARGFVYHGPVNGALDDGEPICPWCIADGSAHEHFDAEFTDMGIRDDDWDDVPPGTVDEVAQRTPGFYGWQQERWLAHCGDAAAFLRRAGADDLPPDAIESIRAEVAEYEWPAGEVDEYVASLDAEGAPSAYLFRCLRCGRHLAYSDMH